MENEKPIKRPEDTTILVVDDKEENTQLLELVIGESGYNVITAPGGDEALFILHGEKSENIDLVITDIIMPDVSGLELTQKIKGEESTRHIPVILLTASKADYKDIAKGLELGADDFLLKPVNPVALMARARSLLRVKHLYDKLSDTNKHLEELVEERTDQALSARDAALIGFAKLAEYRDPETGQHLDRIQRYAVALAKNLLENGIYSDKIDKDFIHQVGLSSALHDIGKVGIPDAVLLKRGRLTEDEFEVMKEHTTIGGDTLATAQRREKGGDGFLTMGKEIAYYHHEKWNGEGYPKGLSGDQIPLSARIMAVADVYDALVTRRVYKDAFTHEKAYGIVCDESGKSFDPAIVDSFKSLEQVFLAIKAKYDEDQFDEEE